MKWIKLTPQQASQIAALSASNTGNGFVSPRLDANGDAWLGAGILNGLDLFSHYASVLSQLAPTHDAEPTWPFDPS